MKVVGHEDVALDENAAFVGVMVEQGEKLAAVLVGEKDGLPVIATLGDVEGIVRGSESWFARHSLDKWDFAADSSHLFWEKDGGGA